MSVQEPTPNQLQVLHAVRELYKRYRYAPTSAELAEYLGLNVATLRTRISHMRRAGFRVAIRRTTRPSHADLFPEDYECFTCALPRCDDAHPDCTWRQVRAARLMNIEFLTG